jgi:hypothetical protein
MSVFASMTDTIARAVAAVILKKYVDRKIFEASYGLDKRRDADADRNDQL